MSKNTRANKKGNPKIDEIGVTDEKITDRGGLSLFVKYLEGIKIYPHLDRLFGALRKSRKGLPICEILGQLICFFVDGTSRHVVHFDRLKEDAGYAAAIETSPAGMISSHAAKRFLRSFWFPRMYLFRRLLQELFIWRLKITRPSVIIPGLTP